MTNGNGHADDLGARVGVQSQRIANLEGLFADLRRDMNQQIGNVTTAMSGIASKMDERFAAMSAAMAEKNKTQWPVIWSAIGVSFAVLAYFVTQNLTPLKENDARFEQSLVALTTTTNQGFQSIIDKMVTRQEMDWRSERGAEDRVRTETALIDLRQSMLPRNEWSERNASRDHEIASLQRQIDLQRADFQTFANSMGNGRDFITDLKQEVARLRDQLAEIRARQFQRMTAPAPP